MLLQQLLSSEENPAITDIIVSVLQPAPIVAVKSTPRTMALPELPVELSELSAAHNI
jgi:hypothetical protein